MGYYAAEDVYAPCPCGSGKKYKFCCLVKDREERKRLRPSRRSVADLLDKEIVVADLDESERENTLGVRLTEEGRGREAIPHLERSIEAAPFMPPPYNNLALACFLEGDVARAIELSEKVDREIDPGNVFTLASLVHYYLMLDRRADAKRALERLETSAPRDENASAKKCEALARFGAHEKVLETALAETCARELRADLGFFAGTALLNLARYDEAAVHLERATRSPRRGDRARRYLERLRKRQGPGALDGDWPYLETTELCPRGLLDRFKASKDARAFPGIVDGLVAFLNDQPDEAEPIVELLAALDTPRSVEVLRKVAFGTFGADALRRAALFELTRRGKLAPDEEVRVWQEGGWRPMKPFLMEVTGKAPSPLPPELDPQLREMLAAMRSRDWSRAEKLGTDLLSKAPGFPKVYQNLAALRIEQGRTEEAERLLLRAMEIDPSYLFAPASLAMLRVQEGRIEDARDVLKRVVMPAKVHPDAQVAFLRAQALIALEDGHTEAAMSVLGVMRTIDPEAELLSGTPAAEVLLELSELLSRLGQARPARERRLRARLLRRDAGLAECLEGCLRLELLAMARRLSLRGVSTLTKGALRIAVAGHLEGRTTLAAVLGLLSPAARGVLQALVGAGGIQPFAEITRRHGAGGEGEGEEARADAPERGPLEEVESFGLAAEGTVGGLECVLIPRELRGPLAEELARLTA
ncbi:MAG: tetratricopeptide repeat protein [Planctomycetes bacterium]|nr:tetratricopeptide repeat protein [Planctomycetota bacterium]